MKHRKRIAVYFKLSDSPPSSIEDDSCLSCRLQSTGFNRTIGLTRKDLYGDMTMRRKIGCFIMIPVLAGFLFDACSSKRVTLWNGKDLSSWKAITADRGPGSEAVWSVKDGVIHCTGAYNGYLRTVSDYSNYILSLEWRWVETTGNSGVLLHAQGPDKVWPDCLECQLQSGHAGDFVLIGPGSIMVDDNHYVNETGYRVIPKMSASSEKPAGEWNHYRIVCRDGEITCFVNKVLQNHGIASSRKTGKICLQSEGAPVEFRNICLERIE